MKQRADISYMLFLAVTAAVGGLLFGYDTAVISGTVELVTARFGLDSLQQGWYVGCALAGSVAGVLCAGVLIHKPPYPILFNRYVPTISKRHVKTTLPIIPPISRLKANIPTVPPISNPFGIIQKYIFCMPKGIPETIHNFR